MIAARASIALLFALQSLGGLRLDEAISLFQHEGLTVIYSSALVRPQMRVEQEPQAGTPRGRLEEILAPHGLRIVEGPHHELLVVAAEKPAAKPPPQPKPEFNDTIVVTPVHIPGISEPSVDLESLSHDQVSLAPNPPSDTTRAIQHLPGVAGTDVSAAVNIRGSANDETLIALDGLELSEPFHLKDFFNVFSTLDAASVGHVDLMTGAYPAQWGDRLGGVIDMGLLTPPSSESSSLWAGTLNGGFSSRGTTNGNGDTNWLVSARGWYPDGVFNFDKDRSELVNTDCYDFLGKLEHRFGEHTTASLSLLGAYDNLGYRNFQSDETDRSTARENSTHVWLTTQTDWSESTSVRSILAVGRLSRDRIGTIIASDLLRIGDRRDFNFVELKQDWRASQLAFGFDAKSSDARYDYTRSTGDTPLVDTHLLPHEQTIGFYASDHLQLFRTVVADVGLRWDHQSLLGRSQLSPRVNVLWTIAPDSTLRVGWGRYYQSQHLNELQVEDGVTAFAPPELAESRTLSFEHRFPMGVAFRVEAFDKPMASVRPRFENMLNPIDVFPEAQSDRVIVAPSRSRLSGLETALSGNAGDRTSWSISYVHSRAIDTIGDQKVPRSWDQPDAASGSMNFALNSGWTAGFAAGYHTGWPTTPMQAVMTAQGPELVAGERNSQRLPVWFRLDARLAKSIRTRRGDLLLSLDIINLTNHQNVCCVKDVSVYERTDGTLGVNREDRSIIPFFPSLSARWNF